MPTRPAASVDELSTDAAVPSDMFATASDVEAAGGDGSESERGIVDPSDVVVDESDVLLPVAMVKESSAGGSGDAPSSDSGVVTTSNGDVRTPSDRSFSYSAITDLALAGARGVDHLEEGEAVVVIVDDAVTNLNILGRQVGKMLKGRVELSLTGSLLSIIIRRPTTCGPCFDGLSHASVRWVPDDTSHPCA